MGSTESGLAQNLGYLTINILSIKEFSFSFLELHSFPFALSSLPLKIFIAIFKNLESMFYTVSFFELESLDMS